MEVEVDGDQGDDGGLGGLGLVPGLISGTSRSCASGVETQAIRSGWEFIAVGPHLTMS